MGVGLVLQIIGTIFFGLSALNVNIPGTSSLGIGATLWGISFLL